MGLAGAVAVIFLTAAAAPTVLAFLGALRSLPLLVRPNKGAHALAIILTLLALVRARPSSAEVPPPAVRLEHATSPSLFSLPAPGATNVYVVQSGDSLWGIAQRYLEAESGVSPSSADISRFWRRIYQHNREVIGADPDLIFPGQRFEIPRR